MKNKRVRIWNSKLAHRIDCQLTSQWDRAIFRKMITQNEVDERQLRVFLRRWRKQGESRSFCEFLVDTGLLSVEQRNLGRMDLRASDPDEEALWVLLIPQTCVEESNVCGLQMFFSGFVSKLYQMTQVKSYKDSLNEA